MAGTQRVGQDFAQTAQQGGHVDRFGTQIGAAPEGEQTARDGGAPLDRIDRPPGETAERRPVRPGGFSISAAAPETACSTLLKSCAMPPASWPSACRRSAWAARACAASRAATSSRTRASRSAGQAAQRRFGLPAGGHVHAQADHPQGFAVRGRGPPCPCSAARATLPSGQATRYSVSNGRAGSAMAVGAFLARRARDPRGACLASQASRSGPPGCGARPCSCQLSADQIARTGDEVALPDAEAGGLAGKLQAGFALAQRRLGVLAGGDVLDDGDEAFGVPSESRSRDTVRQAQTTPPSLRR